MPEDAAHSLQRTVDGITGYRRRTRKLVGWLAAVTAASLLVAGFACFLYIRLHDSNVGNCAAGNVTRAQQKQLWGTLFTLASENTSSPPSAQSRKLTAEFLGDVKATYAPVDCSSRYPFW
jgi:hypothetical protein